MNSLRFYFYGAIVFVVVYFFIYHIRTDKPIPKASTTLVDNFDSPYLSNIWNQRCKNGGIYFPDHCRCPPSVTGEQCEIDNCSPDIDWSPTSSKQNGTDVVCQFPPTVFHCYRQEIKKRDEIRVNKLSDYSSLTEKLEFIFDYYGPWTSEDTMVLHYLLRPTDFSTSKKSDIWNPKSIAFVIMLHTYPTVFSMHWHHLYRPYHQYIIHMDASMDAKGINLVRLTVGNVPNVEILSLRFDGLWGGVSLVYLEVAALARLVSKGAYWNHVINLSNNDFLIKPIEKLEDFLWNLGKSSIIQGAVKVDGPVEDRYTKIHYFCPIPERNRLYTWHKHTPDEPSSANYAFQRPEMEYKAGGWGSQWHMLSRELAEFIVTDIRALEVLMSLKHTLIPDEFYFQLVAKSFDFPVIDNSTYRWINWDSYPLEQMVTEKDIPALKEATDKFFTRKVQPKLVPMLIKELLQ